MHRTLHTSAAVTVVVWAAAYLLGSIPFSYVLSRSTIRRDLRRVGSVDLRTLLTGRPADPAGSLPTGTELAGALLDTVKVVVLVLVALVVIRSASPGFNRGDLPPPSDVGFLTSEILTFWQSGALWAGAAAAAGHLHPVWLGGRGQGQGVAPVLALAVRCDPIGFVVAVGAFIAIRVAGGGDRAAVLTSLGAFIGWTCAAWLGELGHWWGFLPGPELAIWSAVVAGLVGGRALSGRSVT